MLAYKATIDLCNAYVMIGENTAMKNLNKIVKIVVFNIFLRVLYGH
jgi:hypothetical protein